MRQVLLLLTVLFGAARAWWLLSETDPSYLEYHPSACGMVPGLTMKQRELCARHPDVIKFLIEGLRMAISECQHSFRDQVWNCSLTARGVGPMPLKIASKESAYVYAISSAGVSYALAKACAKGLIDDCGCGPTPSSLSKKFVWAGCSDNVRFGNSFGRKFIDANEKAHGDARSLMNLHNNRVGRRLLAGNMVKQCKCHGVSGSCVTKTCWKVVPRFDDYANNLRNKYELAQQVHVAPHGNTLLVRGSSVSSTEGGRAERYLKEVDTKKVVKNELVFLDPSPNYCNIDTRGRDCGNDCKKICCGRGWHTVREVVEEPCECLFVWCCEVKCKTCKKSVERNYCR